MRGEERQERPHLIQLWIDTNYNVTFNRLKPMFQVSVPLNKSKSRGRWYHLSPHTHFSPANCYFQGFLLWLYLVTPGFWNENSCNYQIGFSSLGYFFHLLCNNKCWSSCHDTQPKYTLHTLWTSCLLSVICILIESRSSWQLWTLQCFWCEGELCRPGAENSNRSEVDLRASLDSIKQRLGVLL